LSLFQSSERYCTEILELDNENILKSTKFRILLFILYKC